MDIGTDVPLHDAPLDEFVIARCDAFRQERIVDDLFESGFGGMYFGFGGAGGGRVEVVDVPISFSGGIVYEGYFGSMSDIYFIEFE